MKYFGINVIGTLIGMAGVIMILAGLIIGVPLCAGIFSGELAGNPFAYSMIALPLSIFVVGCFFIAVCEVLSILVSIDKNLNSCAGELTTIRKEQGKPYETKA